MMLRDCSECKTNEFVEFERSANTIRVICKCNMATKWFHSISENRMFAIFAWNDGKVFLDRGFKRPEVLHQLYE